MRKPIFVRDLTEDKRKQLEAGLRSSDAFTVRRSQIDPASDRRETAPTIAQFLGGDDQTVRNVIRALDARGLEALKRGSRRPHNTRPAGAYPALSPAGQKPLVLGQIDFDR